MIPSIIGWSISSYSQLLCLRFASANSTAFFLFFTILCASLALFLPEDAEMKKVSCTDRSNHGQYDRWKFRITDLETLGWGRWAVWQHQNAFESGTYSIPKTQTYPLLSGHQGHHLHDRLNEGIYFKIDMTKMYLTHRALIIVRYVHCKCHFRCYIRFHVLNLG